MGLGSRQGLDRVRVRCGVCFVQWQKTNQARTRHRSPFSAGSFLLPPRSLVVCLHMQNAQTATENGKERETEEEAEKTLAADNGHIDKRLRHRSLHRYSCLLKQRDCAGPGRSRSLP